jgi:DNA-binding LytR/AlgR family response regulator
MAQTLNIFVAEDEQPAYERLVEALREAAPHARVVGRAASVRDAAQWLDTHAAPDVLLLDMQLADGLSLELFRSRQLTVPVIFTTAYDAYALAAFRTHAIDYLLKPVDPLQLGSALAKLGEMRRHFAAEWLDSFVRHEPQRFRERLLASIGTRQVVLPVGDVAYCVSVDKASYAVTFDGQRSLLGETLTELEALVDPARFFRVNRQALVNIVAVAELRGAGKGKIEVDLRAGGMKFVVSQERAAAFRAWVEGGAGTP